MPYLNKLYGFFSRWYSLLAKRQMAGALLPVCGLSMGLVMVQSVRVTPTPFDVDVGFYGVRLIGFSTYTFALVMVLFAINWLIV
jgi:hypothetical protein